MRLFDQLNHFFNVKNTISASANTQSDDVLKTKSALMKTGDYKVPNFGITDIPDMGMIEGLKRFQQKNGLKVDGVMKPKGPTEAKLKEAMVHQGVSVNDLLNTVKSAPYRKTDRIAPLVDFPEIKTPKLEKPITQISAHLKAQQKTKLLVIPEGKTVQQRIASMMQDRRYQDKQDTRLKDHISQQFKKAFPGEVSYDETGKMNQLQAAIKPEDVEPFDPDGELHRKVKKVPQEKISVKPIENTASEKEGESSHCTLLKQDLDKARQDSDDANDDANGYHSTLKDQVDITDLAWEDFINTLLDIGLPSPELPQKPHSDDDANDQNQRPKKQLFSFNSIERLIKRFVKVLDIANYLSSVYDAYSTYSNELDTLEKYREDWLSALEKAKELLSNYVKLRDQYNEKCGD